MNKKNYFKIDDYHAQSDESAIILSSNNKIIGNVFIINYNDSHFKIDNGLNIDGDLIIDNFNSLKHIKGSFFVSGDVTIKNCDNLLSINNINAGGNIKIINCKNLTKIGLNSDINYLVSRKDIIISNNEKLSIISSSIHTRNIFIDNCISFKRFNSFITALDIVSIQNSELQSFDANYLMCKQLIIKGSTSLMIFPKKVIILKSLVTPSGSIINKKINRKKLIHYTLNMFNKKKLLYKSLFIAFTCFLTYLMYINKKTSK